MDGHWVRTREATRGALSADDAGRVKSEIALSKHANGPGSRPITPQDCVSENDSLDGRVDIEHPRFGSERLESAQDRISENDTFPGGLSRMAQKC